MFLRSTAAASSSTSGALLSYVPFRLVFVRRTHVRPLRPSGSAAGNASATKSSNISTILAVLFGALIGVLLLLAAIYSAVCELSQLRAKCFVHHRDRISDLAGWKKRADRFYFTRLFDPWLRKEFDVIPVTTVRNGAWRGQRGAPRVWLI